MSKPGQNVCKQCLNAYNGKCITTFWASVIYSPLINRDSFFGENHWFCSNDLKFLLLQIVLYKKFIILLIFIFQGWYFKEGFFLYCKLYLCILGFRFPCYYSVDNFPRSDFLFFLWKVFFSVISYFYFSNRSCVYCFLFFSKYKWKQKLKTFAYKVWRTPSEVRNAYPH